VTAPTIVADPVLVLAEVICRLRHAGAEVPMDRESLVAASQHTAALLAALGLPVVDGELAEADWLMLRCVAAPRS
jgi:hypothetical protein